LLESGIRKQEGRYSRFCKRASRNFKLGGVVTETVKYLLDEAHIPKYAYKFAADLPVGHFD
jgi:hypothetical protein